MKRLSMFLVMAALILAISCPASAYLYQDGFETTWSGNYAPGGPSKDIAGAMSRWPSWENHHRLQRHLWPETHHGLCAGRNAMVGRNRQYHHPLSGHAKAIRSLYESEVL